MVAPVNSDFSTFENQFTEIGFLRLPPLLIDDFHMRSPLDARLCKWFSEADIFLEAISTFMEAGIIRGIVS
jgi:hypothetical protein